MVKKHLTLISLEVIEIEEHEEMNVTISNAAITIKYIKISREKREGIIDHLKDFLILTDITNKSKNTYYLFVKTKTF